jgi:DNA-binding winged helix-turn-helix (wHTH) protein
MDQSTMVGHTPTRAEGFPGPDGAIIDLAGYQIVRDGASIPLTRREGQLLECLASKPGAVLSRADLAALIGGGHSAWGQRTLDVYISRLRNKLGDLDCTYIQTVRKVGYRLNAAIVNGSRTQTLMPERVAVGKSRPGFPR